MNALFLENGDCWYAEPEFGMETQVRKHQLVGSMNGLIKARDVDRASLEVGTQSGQLSFS